MGRKENKAVAIFCEKIITFGESPKCREILLSYFESLHHFGIRATPRLFSINNCAIPPTFHHPMPATRSGNSYNMSNPQVPNNPHIPNNPNREQPNLQQQVTQITTVLEQLTHRLDAMDERRAREGRRSPNRRRRGPPPEESLDESDREEEEDLEDEEHREFEARRPRFQHYRGDPRNRGRRGTGYQPLDELTKRMKVDVPDFHGKLEPNAFEDWLTAIEDYFPPHRRHIKGKGNIVCKNANHISAEKVKQHSNKRSLPTCHHYGITSHIQPKCPHLQA